MWPFGSLAPMELQAPLQPGRRSSRPRWPPSPHGRERRGGWLKRRLTQEVESGRCIFDSLDELDEFLAQITAAKNRWWNQRGHSPVQLVFGELPRVSAELLSDGPGGLQPLADSLHDPAGGDEVGVEFRRRMAIRDWARQLAMENDSKEAIQKAIKTTTSPTRRWNIGQWVYVFRRAKPGDSLHPTSRCQGGSDQGS